MWGTRVCFCLIYLPKLQVVTSLRPDAVSSHLHLIAGTWLIPLELVSLSVSLSLSVMFPQVFTSVSILPAHAHTHTIIINVRFKIDN